MRKYFLEDSAFTEEDTSKASSTGLLIRRSDELSNNKYISAK